METQLTQNPGNGYRENVTVTASSASGDSAVAWCAVFAGAVASASLSLILLFLGSGFGLTLVSPWSNEGISATSFGVSSILGITVISLLASAMGGYLAGRLRTRWINTPVDEVFFRDTAHGFLSWSVATLGTAALLTTVIGTIIGGSVKTGAALGGATAAAGAATAVAIQDKAGDGKDSMDASNSPMPYLLDSMLRKDATATTSSTTSHNPQPQPAPGNPTDTTSPTATPETNGTSTTVPAPSATKNPGFARGSNNSKGEIARIFKHALAAGSLPENDTKYVGQLVAQTTGVDQQTAEKRVTDTFSTLQNKLQEMKKSAKEVADTARKTSATISLWLFISLLSGAFIASLMAVYGGRQRDL